MSMIDQRDPLEATWSQPAYWEGAVKTREQLGDHEGAARAESIIDALKAGKPLDEIPEFIRWLAYPAPGLHV